jgi:hypothetical protein
MNVITHDAPRFSLTRLRNPFSQAIWQLYKGFIQSIQFCFNPMKQIKGNNDREPNITDKWQDLIHL